MTHVEGQMIENLKWSAEVVCRVYHVPPYKVGVGALPRYNNVQALNVEYYSQALQSHIEEIEELLDHALGIGWGVGLGTEFDTDNLLRMDSTTLVTTIRDAVGAGVMSPNEGRGKLDLKPVAGGESPYLQQQNYSLAALAKRDAQADPFATAQRCRRSLRRADNDDAARTRTRTASPPSSRICAASQPKGLPMLDVGKMVDAVLEVVDKPLRAFAERLKTLETRAPEVPLAPDDVAEQVASTIAMLAESPVIQRSQAAVVVAPRPRRFTFERDESGEVVAAHEGGDA